MKTFLPLILATFIFPALVSAQPCATKLSAGAYAYASSVYDSKEAGYATDGDLGTRWESQYTDPQWLTVDLGVSHTICSVILRWENAAGRDFEIQTSNDASSWSTVSTITNNPTLTNTINFSASARYVRMYGTARTTAYGFSLFEMEVFGTPAGSSTTNLAAGTTPVASSENGGNPATHAFDNNLGTRWESGFTDNQFIYMDLGSLHSIEKVQLNWEAAYGRNFQIQFSADASIWNTVYNFTGNYSLVNNIYFSGNARYVRMQGINRATGYGYSLLEFGVFGTSAVLPVSLTSFSVKKSVPRPELEWRTSAEPNFASFEIQKKQAGNSDFIRVATIKSKGSSTAGSVYAWVDADAANATTFYRLKMIDTDGRYKYSEIVSVRASSSSPAIQFSYNSFNASVRISTEADEQLKKITILNVSGSPLISMAATGNQQQVSLAEKPAGIYFVRIQTNKRMVVERVIKPR